MPNSKFNNCIVIPCYNEEKELENRVYDNFLESNTNNLLCFVDDGSTDKTQTELAQLANQFPDYVTVYRNKKNVGKAASVQNGINFCLENFDFDTIGYLDADLATTLEEYCEISEQVKGKIMFAFGSRILKLGSVIQRKRFRFVTGRIIATVISSILRLKVYDTQCGAKVMTKELATVVFKDSFVSRWMFDVEIFIRIMAYYGKEEALGRMIEIPLKLWVDKGDSKVKFTYFFKLWLDLLRINNVYNKNIKSIQRTNYKLEQLNE